VLPTGSTGSARRPKSAQRLALRSRIVLACGEGASNQAVARQYGVSTHTVGKWRERFHTHRLEGLADEPRLGAPREITDAQAEAVVTRTLESTPPTRPTRKDRAPPSFVAVKISAENAI
jgi:transposase